jgi:hypothetical protein
VENVARVGQSTEDDKAQVEDQSINDVGKVKGKVVPKLN